MTQIEIGDKMIFEGSSTAATPKVVTVTGKTPAGWLYVEGFKPAFRPNGVWNTRFSARGINGELIPYDEEKLAQIEQRNAQHEAYLKEKAEKQEQIRQERETRIANEMAEVKELLGDMLPIRNQMILPDNSKLVTLAIPVKTSHQRLFDVIVVRLRDIEEYDWNTPRNLETGELRMKKMVEVAATYVDDRGGSFASCSTKKADNWVEGLWEVIRDRFHSNW